jgi:peptide/nickel transport system ATP-binding protein
MANLIDVNNISIEYRGKTVVKDISFSVNEGEILGIVGESGSGKSSVLRAIMGLLPTGGNVSKGEIIFKGKNLLSLSNKEFRDIRGKEISMVFQNCYSSFCQVRTIGDQIYEAAKSHYNLTRKEVYKKAAPLFENMNMSQYEKILKSYPFELSGGMNQRVGIVMAMILNPSLILADEPTSALDVTVQKQVVEEMLNMRKLYNTAFIIVTHNIGVASYMADKIVVMRKGKIEEYGEKEEVIKNPKSSYTKELIFSVPKIGR